jgi:glycosyltransferase involved in cell wall biosynthesis
VTNRKVSIIIPVYNAANFVSRAVNSALECPEVGEVILIEDGSTDESYRVCKRLSNLPKVKLLTHDERSNKGAGPTRNLGLKNAVCDYIAFLDADDYYLENRFKESVLLLETNDSIDGVYGVIGAEYQNEFFKEKHMNRMKLLKRDIHSMNLALDQTGIEINTSPKALFYHLLKSDRGWIHLNALIFRRELLENFEWFNTLRIGQDSDFIGRMANEFRLVRLKENDPIAVRYVHEGNRILNARQDDPKVIWKTWLNYARNKGIGIRSFIFILKRNCDGKHKLKKMVCMLILFTQNIRAVIR